MADGLNRYGYVGGNPETKTDPTGHCFLCSVVSAVTSAVSSAASTVSSVAQAVAPVALQVVGTVTGVSSMISDVQTIANAVQHGGNPLTVALAVGDLALNVAMDASMLTGVGEVAMGMHAAVDVGEHLAADAAEHAAEDTIGHAAEDEAEHAAEDGASEAFGEGAGENCALSFAAGTLVSTSAGLKPIASVKTGDHVTSYDPKAKTASTQTVQATWVTHDTDLLDVTLRPTGTNAPATATSKARRVAVASHGSHAPPSAGTTSNTTNSTSTASQSTASAQSGDETIHTTANHPFLTADRGWAQAGTLTLGEAVVETNGQTAEVVALRNVAGSAPMYDLTVASVHDFAVGTGAYVVHNCGAGDSNAANEGTGTVWDRITPLAEDRPGTRIPERFELEAGGQTFEAVPNATKHMAEYLTRDGSAEVLPEIRAQEMLDSFAHAVDDAVPNLPEGGTFFGDAGGWQLGIDMADNHIYHARPLW